MKLSYSIFQISLMIFLFSCAEEERFYPENSADISLLKELDPGKTGVRFNNRITETEEVNAITFDGMLQGAGVAVLDINNDGLQDIYFASNMEGDRLYLNKGDFKFEDVTQSSGITPNNWSTGVAPVDINNDGYDDIYVCKFLYDDPQRRANAFYINNGDGTFTDKAQEMGLDDKGYGIMANFLDYDRDGDLDLYLANQPPNSLRMKSQLKGQIDYRYTDRLFRNDNGRFVDVTNTAGVKNYSYTLSATTMDYNKDGWPDIYVACDYDEADFLYKNNGDGTFTNVAPTALKHMSNFSMGVDIADINNDGYEDIYVADMVAEDNFRIKTNMSGMNPAKFFFLAENGHHYQYMFNALQLNNGDGSFSEIAQMSGVSNTDWSWTPLFIDFDQDGYKDLVVTNGLIKDMRNKDFEIWRKDYLDQKLKEASQVEGKRLYVNPLEISNEAPSFKIANFIYKNNGDLSFQKLNTEWGFDAPTWSQGMAYADFDNDGDLDLVINNMNMEASLYRNMANENRLNNYINIELEGPEKNREGLNAVVEIDHDSTVQTYHYTPYRGYMSTSQPIAHFGLGKTETIDEIRVIWPDNKMNIFNDVQANRNLKVKYREAGKTYERKKKEEALFADLQMQEISHTENEFDDYAREILLPYRTSTLGPVLAKGDVNGDGHLDIYLGASVGKSGKLLINNGKGGFDEAHVPIFTPDASYEDGGALFFDVDNDGDMDLYVASGGNEYEQGSDEYFDRLYINNGSEGYFGSRALIQISESTAAIAPLDLDGDGDQDLIVGGRQVPGAYGRNPSTYILENQEGRLVNSSLSEDFKELGMVTDIQLGDVDNDGQPEVVFAGEWMPLRVYELAEGRLKESTGLKGLENTNGWWNTIEINDIDDDGDQDIIAGNLGHNIKYKATRKEPFTLYVDDFDDNGTNDVYLGFYQDGKCFPVRGRQCSSEQMPFIKKKFESYEEFGKATIDDVLKDRISPTTVVQQVYTFSNTLFLNTGNGFEEIVLPNEAQISPVYGIAVDDFNKDGNKEIFLAGNMYQREVETTRSDAGKGVLLSLKPDGSMTVKRTMQTGVSADKDVRDIALVKSGAKNLLVIANNNAALQVYQY